MVKRSRLYTSRLIKRLMRWPRSYWAQNWWHKVVTIVVVTGILAVGTMYGIAQWYIHTQTKPQVTGVSFIPSYAQYLGVDPQKTMDSLIGIGVRHFRLVSYWNDAEPEPGHYDFTQLDWQFQKAEAAHAKISLSLGLRQPRWPECHLPDWARTEPESQRQPQLEAYMTAVINRYKDSPALSSYQMENEFFLQGFGTCNEIPGSRDRANLISEYQLVKKLDHRHTIIISRSNNALGWPVGKPRPDEFGVSVYKRVWDAGVTHRYLEYPFPAWYYSFLAGWQKLVTGRDMIVHEMQAEAWAPNGQELPKISLSEQNKSLDAKRLKDRFAYGQATGMPEIYMWGAEYWYYRQQVLHDPSLWDIAHAEFSK